MTNDRQLPADFTDASNDKTKEQADKSREILNKLMAILRIEDLESQKQALNNLIEARLKELLQAAPEEQHITYPIRMGKFIRPDTEIERSVFVDPFRVNDPEIYTKLFESFVKHARAGNRSPLSVVIFALGDYFGNYYYHEDTEQKNVDFYEEHSDRPFEDRTINLSELKNKNIAVCMEKASVAHNFLKFLGIDSHLVVSSGCVIGGSEETNHAYIIYARNDKKYIFDPTNSVLVVDSEGRFFNIKPAVYEISEADYNHLLNGARQPVAVKHFDEVFADGKYQPAKEQTRIYG